MHPRQNKQAARTFVRYCPKPPKMLPPKLRTAIVFPQQLRLAAVSPPQVQPQPSLSSAQPCGSGAWPGAEGRVLTRGRGRCVVGVRGREPRGGSSRGPWGRRKPRESLVSARLLRRHRGAGPEVSGRLQGMRVSEPGWGGGKEGIAVY